MKQNSNIFTLIFVTLMSVCGFASISLSAQEARNDSASFKGHTVLIEQNAGGSLTVMLGDHELNNGDRVPHGSIIKIKAISGKSYLLESLTAGRLEFIATPTNQLVSFQYEVKEATLIRATFIRNEHNEEKKFPVVFEKNDGGMLSVFAGDRKLSSGESVPNGTRITIKAISGKSYLLNSLTAGDTDFVSIPTNSPISVEYEVNKSTLIQATFIYNQPGLFPVKINQNDGGMLSVYVGTRKLNSGDFVRPGTTVTIEAISGKSFWLTRLTAGRLAIVFEPTDMLVRRDYVIKEATAVNAVFTKKNDTTTIVSRDKESVESGAPTNVNEIKDRQTPSVTYLKHHGLSIKYAEQNVPVCLYSMDGRIALCGQTDSTGYCTLDSSRLTTATYILRLGEQTIKLLITN